ncbi:MAG: hypothetical protein AABY22_35600 [Nanoarchaeota archaeon]
MVKELSDFKIGMKIKNKNRSPVDGIKIDEIYIIKCEANGICTKNFSDKFPHFNKTNEELCMYRLGTDITKLENFEMVNDVSSEQIEIPLTKSLTCDDCLAEVIELKFLALPSGSSKELCVYCHSRWLNKARETGSMIAKLPKYDGSTRISLVDQDTLTELLRIN